MAVKDWASFDVWWIGKNAIDNSWCLDPPTLCKGKGWKTSWHDTFAEAHAAYLDAVTCDIPSTWSGVKYRCVRSKGHTGFHMRPRS